MTATRELLWERGFAATSPRDVQRRSRVGQGSMYHHFDGKAELAAAALEATGAEMVAAGAEILDGPGPALDRIAAYLRRERPALRGCPIGRMTGDADVMADPLLRAPVDRTLAWLRRRIAELVAEARADGRVLPGTDADRTAAALVAGLQGAYVLARAADDAAVFDTAIEGVLSLLDAARTDRPRGSDPIPSTEERTAC